MSKQTNTNYIVVITRGKNKNGYFDRLIKPDSYAIERYVENLSFGSEVRMVFYDVSQFEHYDQLIDNSLSDSNVCVMSPEKSANEFTNEVNRMLIKLGIVVEDED